MDDDVFGGSGREEIQTEQGAMFRCIEASREKIELIVALRKRRKRGGRACGKRSAFTRV
jgi:hypothetical protein